MNRRMLDVALGLLTALVIGCGGGTDGEPGKEETPGGEQPNNQTLTWAGTWDASIEYSVRCDHGFGNMQSASYTTSFTVALTGQNSALEAQIDVNYFMTGTGSASKLDLNGTFPLKGADNQKASTRERETDLTLRLDKVMSKDSATGTLSGSFKSGFGNPCDVQSGTVSFTRN
ncbi:MAG TPA: hypothetical protein VNA24_26525 [Hyalangium sp.]|nr:hypothetical protein [Hyalangium sp.]